ncbi:MAG: hypothetical protein EPO11_09120 [Gammaproteobacteria bacterium]|nr:MAG: hypothetical protein EPO11_09120 [Gammaproteobacteria bacterium]
MMKYLSFAISIVALCLVNAKANELYRPIPFTLVANPGDRLIIDYDFSGKSGIRCTAADNKTKIEFTYKGHPKSASLPITLQSSHIPTKVDEALADYRGQFTLMLDAKSSRVSCDYLN